MGLIGSVFALFPQVFISIFIEEGAVLQNGILALRIISLGFLFYALGMVLTQAFNGSGDTITPTKVNFFSFWMFELPLAYFLAITLKMGLTGASWSIVIAESFLTILALILFKKGKWKLRKV